MVDAQYWARTIQRRIRKGLHPFPNKNRTSLKVSWPLAASSKTRVFSLSAMVLTEGTLLHLSPLKVFSFLRRFPLCTRAGPRRDIIPRTPCLPINIGCCVCHFIADTALFTQVAMPITISYTFRFIVIHSSSFACNLFISKFVTLSEWMIVEITATKYFRIFFFIQFYLFRLLTLYR